MKLIIRRYKNINDGTIGKFELVGVNTVLMTGYTLESAGPDTTARGKDRRIPAGLYSVVWYRSPKFNRVVPVLHNEQVPKDRYIEIHAGNYPKHTEGCILVGKWANDEGVFESKATLEALLSFIQGKDLEVEILNEFR
uniref:DUF5675 domain-containing protein n=1 Tax=Myoviridae sp. ctDvB7 TaxID=2825057 RepID=A0A8S5UEC2_9CAUD|nr:MAG TPA: hypothetical protein [Myoviridae sp. ctDvB7]